jgi:opacity protein-like surface antigen
MLGRTSIININPVAILLAILLIAPTQVKAEWTADLYTGMGFTQPHDAQVNLPDFGMTGTHEDLKFDNSALLGARAGYWIDSLSYLGFGLDLSHYFGPDQKAQTSTTTLCPTGDGCFTAPENIKQFNNNVTAVGFDLMLRYPKGRLQPYLTVGPAIFSATLKDTDNFIPAGQSSTSTSWGIQAGIGALFLFTQRMGAFVEYRDSNFQAKDQYNNATLSHGIPLGQTEGTATFNIQAIVGGISFRF